MEEKLGQTLLAVQLGDKFSIQDRDVPYFHVHAIEKTNHRSAQYRVRVLPLGLERPEKNLNCYSNKVPIQDLRISLPDSVCVRDLWTFRERVVSLATRYGL